MADSTNKQKQQKEALIKLQGQLQQVQMKALGVPVQASVPR